MAKIADFSDISLQYKRGWDSEADLAEVLTRNEQADIRYGSTQHGPHRADIVVKHGGFSAVDVLSRGQQKILVSALKLAQGVLQSHDKERACVFLVDDLPAELDEENRARICRFLLDMQSQVFLTSVDESSLENALEKGAKVTKFHVEHGKISA